MSLVVILDSGPLGMVTNARASLQTQECTRWLRSLQYDQGIKVVIPEIADYEVRRELLRAGLTQSIARLDELEEAID